MTAIDPRAAALTQEMLDEVARFERDELSIDRLSWKLKSRVSALQGLADLAWVEQLRAKRNQIELISAAFIESGRDALDAGEREEALESLAELRTMLATGPGATSDQ